MPRTKSILRYPGGKTQLYQFVKHTMEHNALTDVIYCEPFCGGAGTALALLLSEDISSVILNDFDIAIYSIWYAILNETERFINRIKEVNINIEEWHRQRQIYTEAQENNQPEYDFNLAFATFFLNRTNRAGIITGGPIGGYAQNSKYPLGCRLNKTDLIAKIRNIADHGNAIRLYHLDANALINQVLLQEDSQRLFVYFDPPYYKEGKHLYKNFFDDAAHVQLSNSIRAMNNYHWIATYDDEERIKEIYEDYDIHEYNIQYSANKTRTEVELLFHSPITLVESFDKVRF